MLRRTSLKVSLCAYADPLIRDLKRHIPAALKRWDEDSVHRARVATRRLRAAVDLLEPITPGKLLAPMRKTLRRLRRRLGPLRDLDVMIGHLQPLAKHRRHRAAVEWLVQRLKQARDDARRKVRKKETPDQWIGRLDAWAPIREHILQRGQEVRALMIDSLRSQWSQFARQADLLSEQVASRRSEDSQDPHELRVAGKILRYTLEMLAKEGVRLPVAMGRAFKSMQRELGLWHDHVVLTERAMRESIESLLAHHDSQLQAQVLALARAALRRAQQDLRRFAKLWREKGPSLAQIVQELTAGEEAVSAPRKDPDLFDSQPSQTQEGPPSSASSAA